jgi:hypothetical protein
VVVLLMPGAHLATYRHISHRHGVLAVLTPLARLYSKVFLTFVFSFTFDTDYYTNASALYPKSVFETRPGSLRCQILLVARFLSSSIPRLKTLASSRLSLLLRTPHELTRAVNPTVRTSPYEWKSQQVRKEPRAQKKLIHKFTFRRREVE